MIDTLLIFMAMTQVIILFIIGMPISCKVLTNLSFKKNPEWINKHPEFTAPNTLNTINTGFSYLLAAMTSMATVYYNLIAPNSEFNLGFFVFPLCISAVSFLVFIIMLKFMVTNKIPMPEKITASLYDRRITSFVPRWLLYAIGGTLTLIMGFYGFALINGLIDSELAIRRLIGMGLVLLIGFSMLTYIIKRKHSEMEDIAGESGRKYEIYSFIGVLFLGIFVGIWRILEDFYDVSLLSNTVFFLIISFFVQVSMLIYSLNPKISKMVKEYDQQVGRTT